MCEKKSEALPQTSKKSRQLLTVTSRGKLSTNISHSRSFKCFGKRWTAVVIPFEAGAAVPNTEFEVDEVDNRRSRGALA